MKSFKSWRKDNLFLEDQEEMEGQVDWPKLRHFYGTVRELARPELLRQLKSNPLNDSTIEEYRQKYDGNVDELAKDLITAVLKLVFKEEAGMGLAVSPTELGQRATPPALGDQRPGEDLPTPQ